MHRVTCSRHGDVLSWVVFVIHRSMGMNAPACHRMSVSVATSLLGTAGCGVYARRGRSELLVVRVREMRLRQPPRVECDA